MEIRETGNNRSQESVSFPKKAGEKFSKHSRRQGNRAGEGPWRRGCHLQEVAGS